MKNSFSKKIGAVIQARMGSERLPGKALMKVGGKPILEHILGNLKASKYLSQIILATTKQDEDTALLELAEKLQVDGFAGSENDVLTRYIDAANAFQLDVVVRITGDNILTDVEGMDKTIALYLKREPDVATNGGEEGYPLGTAVEVLSASLLQKLNKIVCFHEEREHVTLHLYKNQEKYRISYLKAPVAYKNNIRLTIDSPEDLALIRLVYEKLRERKEDFKLPFVVKCFRKHKEIVKINSHIKQRSF
ncbi:MAG: acylneuraminate cytidylyltransferase [Parcubacteria group bacterium]|nr:acylneuraminate cytidylyltransferase [Parcubacteria group bacterium]